MKCLLLHDEHSISHFSFFLITCHAMSVHRDTHAVPPYVTCTVTYTVTPCVTYRTSARTFSRIAVAKATAPRKSFPCLRSTHIARVVRFNFFRIVETILPVEPRCANDRLVLLNRIHKRAHVRLAHLSLGVIDEQVCIAAILQNLQLINKAEGILRHDK